MKILELIKAGLGILLVSVPIWAAGMFFLQFNDMVHPKYDEDVTLLWISRSGLFLGLSAIAGAYLLSKVRLKRRDGLN